jgi:GTP cyclohydrolase II
LLTNNPQKIADLEAGRIQVVERVVQRILPRPENQRYLQTKAEKLGHLFGDVVVPEAAAATIAEIVDKD